MESNQNETSQSSPKCSRAWLRELCILLIGIVCGATLFAIYSHTTYERNLQSNLFLTYETDLAYDEAVALFEKKASQLPGWSVRREYCQLPANIAIFKLCHKRYAGRLLNTEERRKMAAILPCSFAIYATDNGKTRLVRINGPLLEKVVDGENTMTFQEQIMPEQDALLKMCGFNAIK